MRVFYIVLMLGVLSVSPVLAQSIELSPITVVGTSTNYNNDVSYSPLAPEYLADQSSGVDVQSRMGFGWLQDVSIRASIFEDANVNLNGVSLNNPQTGHFNLSFPGVSTDIRNANVDLNGQKIGFQLVRPHQEENYLRIASGSAGFAENTISMTRKIGEGFHRFSLEGMRTDGLRDDTDGYRAAGSYLFSQSDSEQDILFYAATSQKQFGENGAYAAPWYMREEEKIKQDILIAQWTLHEKLDFTIKPYIQRTQDTFWLDRENPTGYRNDHTSYVGGNIFEISDPQSGRYVSFEFQRDQLRSTNLGDRNRVFYSVEAGLKTQYYGRWDYAGGVKAKYFDEFPFEILPHAEIGYQLSNFWHVNLQAQRLYRQPSYTELYYVSSSNQGNPDLQPQTIDNIQWGINYKTEERWFNADLFYRRQQDTIDWVRNAGDTKYMAINAGKVNVRGFDIGFGLKQNLILFDTIDFSYTRLDVNKETLYDISKYVFDYLRDRFIIKLNADRGKWEYGLKCVYEYHITLRDRWIFGAEAAYHINKNTKLFADAENIFDENYEEFPNIQGEPLFVKAGLEVRF